MIYCNKSNMLHNYLYIYNIAAMTINSNSESTPATNAPAKDTAAWYTLSVDECTRRLEVDPATGLGTNESAQRLQQYGHNELAEAKKESAIKAFLRQYHSLMQIVLSAMTLVSIIIHNY